MTFDRARVRQIAEEAWAKGCDEMTDAEASAVIEAAILAAARELLGEPSEEMQTAGYRAFLSGNGGTADLRVWKAMSAARLAELKEE